jgi:hypothetical protein
MLVDESASAVQQNAFTFFKRGSSRLGCRTMQPRPGNDRRQAARAADFYPISQIFPVIHTTFSQCYNLGEYGAHCTSAQDTPPNPRRAVRPPQCVERPLSIGSQRTVPQCFAAIGSLPEATRALSKAAAQQRKPWVMNAGSIVPGPAILTAMRRASSRVSRFMVIRRPGSRELDCAYRGDRSAHDEAAN